MKLMMKKYLPPVLWILGFQIISGLIGYTTSNNMGWYEDLNKSAFTPPDIAFPVVWTTLYILLALAAWQVWKGFQERGINKAFVLFWLQMALNWGWSFVFFEFHQVALGFYWICALNIAMLAYVIVQWPSNKLAALLVVPTILWGSFAAYLNYAIMVMN